MRLRIDPYCRNQFSPADCSRRISETMCYAANNARWPKWFAPVALRDCLGRQTESCERSPSTVSSLSKFLPPLRHGVSDCPLLFGEEPVVGDIAYDFNPLAICRKNPEK
jgi:hypothetical protein